MAIGKKTGGGSRKGKPNKATAALKDMILGALNAKKGQKWLEQQMDANPAAFMTLLGKVLPTTLQGPDGGAVVAPVLNVRIDAPSKETREEWLARQQMAGLGVCERAPVALFDAGSGPWVTGNAPYASVRPPRGH